LQAMAVLFVVYMPNEDRENFEDDEPVSPAPSLLPEVATVNGKILNSVDDGSGENGVVPKTSTDVEDCEESSVKKPLLKNVCNNSMEQTSNTSSEKPLGDDKHDTKHQSLLTLDVDKSIPRRSSENVLTCTKLENTQSDVREEPDSVVLKGDKVRFQVTKLDSQDTEEVKPSVELVTETKEEKKQSLIPDEEADVVMDRFTLKEVGSRYSVMSIQKDFSIGTVPVFLCY